MITAKKISIRDTQKKIRKQLNIDSKKSRGKKDCKRGKEEQKSYKKERKQ